MSRSPYYRRSDILIGQLERMIQRQAWDQGLWAIAETAQEAYLQQELRKLHASCEVLVSQWINEGAKGAE